MLGHKKWSPLPGVSRLLHLSLWTMARLLGESLLIQVPAGKSRGGKIQEAVAGATLLLDSSHSTSLVRPILGQELSLFFLSLT